MPIIKIMHLISVQLITKGNLLTNSRNKNCKRMYGDQSGEFVCEYGCLLFLVGFFVLNGLSITDNKIICRP